MMQMLIDAGIKAVKPEIFLLLSTVFLLLFGLYRGQKVRTGFIIVSLLVIIASGYMVLCPQGIDSGTFLDGMFASNAFTVFAKSLILISGVLVLMLSSAYLREDGGRPFEFIILMLFALLGMMLMVSAADLLALYMALEMSSLALYVLASFNRDHAKSSEAGLKYFVLGALASGMMLFGMSLVYGFAGSTSFSALAQLFDDQYILSKGVVLGLVLIIVGFCFKLSAVPFHMWTPDVYEGAPTPVTAFFATAPKIAAMALFTRFLLEPFANADGQWQQIIVFVSLTSMLVGAFGAITQSNIKRLLAYSSIGHVGFMLMALAANNNSGVQAILIYLSVYIFMSTGMFGCVLLMKRDGKPLVNIKDLSGLSQNNPLMAIVISICIFSMAGIPPMSGFFGKMYVVLAAIEGGLAWLAVIGVLTSVIGCYYYLKIVKIMYFDAQEAKFDSASSRLVNGAIAISAAVTMLFFLVPTQLIILAKNAATVLIK
jgi:NADH-quinone oxidoreductase subunit N